jgi:hypothetical protein
MEPTVKAAVAEARYLLGRLGLDYVSWSDPDPRDAFRSAVGAIDSILNDPNADSFLGALAPIVRKVIIPALKQGLPPKQLRRGQPTNSFRDRLIAETVEQICRRGFSPTRNEASDQECGCSIVAEALGQLGIRLKEKSVARIWAKHKA